MSASNIPKQLKEKTKEFNLHGHQIKTSKKENGINIYSTKCDEFEIWEYLHDLIKENVLDFRFKYPRHITKFRDPDFHQAPKKDAEWIK